MFVIRLKSFRCRNKKYLKKNYFLKIYCIKSNEKNTQLLGEKVPMKNMAIKTPIPHKYNKNIITKNSNKYT